MIQEESYYKVINIGSHDYEHCEVPCPKICKLDSQENWWFKVLKIRKLFKSAGLHGSPKSESLRTRSAEARGSLFHFTIRQSYCKISPSFCSLQTSNILDVAQPHRGGPPASLSPSIQMLISSKKTLKIHPEIMFNQQSGCPLTHSMNHSHN